MDERRTVIQGGRRKALRPLPREAIDGAFAAGLAAYRRGDFFEAHELLEPAWMGTADPAERDLYQGLIKVAAGGVHAVRGNATGLAKNLRGARARLARVAPEGGHGLGIDVPALIGSIDARLAALEGGPAPDRSEPPLPIVGGPT